MMVNYFFIPWCLIAIWELGSFVDGFAIPSQSPTYSPAPTSPPIPTSLSTVEYTTLKEFYYNLDGPNWLWPEGSGGIPWNFQNNRLNNPCADNWNGVACNCADTSNPVIQSGFCYVELLNITAKNVSGTIVDSFGALSYLSYFQISGRMVGGQLPPSMANMTELRTLQIQFTSIGGLLSPQLVGGWQLLEVLDLYQNAFYGALPAPMYSLEDLWYLNLGSNNFSGIVDRRINNLGNLKVLNLRANKLYGQILPYLTNMTNLQRIDVGFNRFTGTLPVALNNLTHLTLFSIAANRYECTIPEELGLTWIWLEIFEITDNRIWGTLPDDFGINMVHLRKLYMARNDFEGPLPATITSTSLHSLTGLFVEYNRFTGTFDNNTFAQLQHLQEVGFEYNLFEGDIYNLFYNGTHARKIRIFGFGGNLFHGLLPRVDPATIQLYIGDNSEFVGTIPEYFSEAYSLVGFAVSFNLLSGTIPDWQGQLPQLVFNVINNNFLTSSIPDTFLNTTQIQDIIYNDNYLSHSIPPSASSIHNLIELYLGNNMLTGSIPKNIFAIIRLEITYVQNNFMTGDLLPQYNVENIQFDPNDFDDDFINEVKKNHTHYNLVESSLINVDVSNNKFSGTVPPLFFLFAPKLRAYVLSSNCFVGKIPETICGARGLTSLALDGLGSAKYCQQPLFPDIPYFTSFRTSTPINGGVPSCLFQMPDLQMLRLSGNGLTGTIPEILNNPNNISKSLTQLSLANNALQGTIPFGIQSRSWVDLDLSFNKLSGTLMSSFSSININSTVNLQINRLSGTIPESFLVDNDANVGSINMLDGNIFACQDLFGSNEKKLPKHDPNHEIYSCGSDVINRALLLWVLFVIGMICLIAIWLSMIYTPVGRRIYESLSRRNSARNSTKRLSGLTVSEEDRVSALTSDPKYSAHGGGWMRESERGPSFFGRFSAYIQNDPQVEGGISTAATKSSKPWYWKPWMDDVVDWISILSLQENLSQMTNTKGAVTQLQIQTLPLPKCEPLYQLVEFMKSVRKIFFVVTAFMLCIMMPWCELLTTHLGGGTYTYEYAWSTSPILQSGDFSGISLFILFSIVVLLVMGLFEYYFRDFWDDEKEREKTRHQKLIERRQEMEMAESEKENEKEQFATTRPWMKYVPQWLKNMFCPVSSNLSQLITKQEQAHIARKKFENRVIFCIVGTLNLLLMILIDILYVVIILNSNAVVVFFTQFGLGIFKLIWNEMFLWKVIPRLKYVLFRRKTINAEGGKWDIEQYKFSKPEVWFIILTVLLNNIIIPCMSIAVVSSDCYYNAFFAEPPVTSTTLYECNYAISFLAVETCVGESTYTENITYYPPFSYRYQCSAAFITNYAAVYVYMFIVVGLVIPTGKILLKLLYDKLIIDDSGAVSGGASSPKDNVRSSQSTAVGSRYTTDTRNNPTTDGERGDEEDPAVMNPVISGRRSSFFRKKVDEEVGKDGVEMFSPSESNSKKSAIHATSTETQTFRPASLMEPKQVGPLHTWKMRLLGFVEIFLPENLRDIEFANDVEEVDVPLDGSGSGNASQERIQDDGDEGEDMRRRSTSISLFFQDRMTSIGNRMASIVREATASSNKMLQFPTTTTVNVEDLSKAAAASQDNSGVSSSLQPWMVSDPLQTDGVLQTGVGTLDEREERALFFYRNKFVVKMNAYFAILLTFGTIFPPLSLLICTAAFTSTWYEHLVLGRVLVLAKRHRSKVLKQLELDSYRLRLQLLQQQNQSSDSSTTATHQKHQKLLKRLALVKDYYRLLRQKLNKEVSGITLYFSTSMWIVIIFGCLSYAFVLFDTFGDVGGWQGAAAPTAIMICLPIILFICRQLLIKSWKMYHGSEDNKVPPINHSKNTVKEGHLNQPQDEIDETIGTGVVSSSVTKQSDDGTNGEDVPPTKSEDGRSAIALGLLNATRAHSIVSNTGSIRRPISSVREIPHSSDSLSATSTSAINDEEVV